MRRKTILILTLLCLFLLAFGAGVLNGKAAGLERELDRLQEEIRSQELQIEITRALLDEVRRLRAENEELARRMGEGISASSLQ